MQEETTATVYDGLIQNLAIQFLGYTFFSHINAIQLLLKTLFKDLIHTTQLISSTEHYKFRFFFKVIQILPDYKRCLKHDNKLG